MRGSGLHIATACAIAVLLVLDPASAGPSKPVRVNLHARWASSRFWPLLETSEFLAEENPQLYWDFLPHAHAVALNTSSVDGSAVVIDAAVTAAAPLLDAMTQQLLRLDLASRTYAPAVEFAQQLAASMQRACQTDASAWAVVDGAVACTPDQLANTLRGPRSASSANSSFAHILPSDCVYPLSPASGGNVAEVVVYGCLTSAALMDMHMLAVRAAERGEARYALRLVACPGEARLPTLLSGFGVVLDIKSMEYRALDDRAPSEEEDALEEDAADEEGAAEEEEGEEDIAGFYFSRLIQHRPELESDLLRFKAHLESAAAEAPQEDIKAWHMQDLGLQTVQAVLESRDPLRRLRDISQNFPQHSKALTRLPVSGTVRKHVGTLHQHVPAGQTRVLVNDVEVKVDSPHFSWHALLAQLRHDWAGRRALLEMGLSAEAAVAALEEGTREAVRLSAVQNAAAAGSSTQRVDVRVGAKGALFFLNNLERDAQYRQWPRSLYTLLQPSWQLHALRRNVYNVIMVLDPAVPKHREMLGSALALVRGNAPLRFALAITSPDLQRLLAPARARGHEPAAPQWDAGLLSTSPTAAAARLLVAARRDSHDAAMDFLQRLAQVQGELTVPGVVEAFAAAVASARGAWTSGAAAQEARALLAGEEVGMELLTLSARYVAGRNLPMPSVLVNGVVLPAGAGQRELMQAVFAELRVLQSLLQTGVLSDTSNVLKRLLEFFRASPRNHPAIVVPPTTMAWAALAWSGAHGPFGGAAGGAQALVPAFIHGLKAPQVPTASLVALVDASSRRGLAQLRECVALLERLSGETDAGPSVAPRIAFVHSRQAGVARCPPARAPAPLAPRTLLVPLLLQLTWQEVASSPDAGLPLLSWLLERSDELLVAIPFDTEPGSKATALVQGFLADAHGAIDSMVTAPELARRLHAALATALAAAGATRGWELTQDGSADVLACGAAVDMMRRAARNSGLAAGEEAILANGRLLPLQRLDAESVHADPWGVQQARAAANAAEVIVLAAEDLALLAEEAARRGERALSVLQQQGSVAQDGRGTATGDAATLVVRVAHVLGMLSKQSRAALGLPAKLYDKALLLDPPAEAGPAAIRVEAVLNPLSEAAQRASGILMALRHHFPRSLSLRVALNPPAEVGEFPLKRFFRFAAGTHTARFSALPSRHVLTMKVETPEPWIVQTLRAAPDLDNLQLANLPGGALSVDYVLHSLTVTGQCDDHTHGRPPNGLQLMLRERGGQGRSSGTLVMQNFGYFQLQSQPGMHDLSIAPGRASALYTLLVPRDVPPAALALRAARGGHVSMTPPADALTYTLPAESRLVAVRSWDGAFMYLPVNKRPGMEDKALLVDAESEPQGADAQGSLWSSVSSLFAPGAASGAASNGTADADTVHVFSLASGHLYERFLRIMMLSVTKRCSRPVKFWLVENFLSPSFKDMVPHMARAVGFQVELVTYKWPSWLREQTEKQRIIWGYKVLFMDVLFPLGLNKVVYVDADQVVRADIAELWDMDLQDHVYAYTPFCTSNKETLGYQFWRSGFWKEHLQGKPYHISALYVVDLKLFRQRAVGDQLRAIYDNLSRDPNSLANLDQDLPNYAQHMVPIFSLPEPWLWCESWCSQESKVAAKTIDLCNNPLRKEPKLDMARRVISGPLFPESWVQLDEEVQAIDAAVRQQHQAS